MPVPDCPLADLEVLIVDCQATAAAPRGQLIELAWSRCRSSCDAPSVRAQLVRLPNGRRLPPAITRITGITNDMLAATTSVATAPDDAWQQLAYEAASMKAAAVPTVIHYARFEQSFLSTAFAPIGLFGESPGPRPPSFDIVCTHAIAKRVLPDLPRRSLRALAGYLGRAVGQLRRSADHVEATAFAWRELVRLLEAEGVTTWPQLRAWLSAPAAAGVVRRVAARQPPLRGVATALKPKKAARAPRRHWPMPRELRLGLPGSPGVYRMLRINGDVLYVGKATALHDRVNSYFRQQQHVPERMLEMLSQARALSYEPTATALEAALVEADEIKRHRPPYNIALTLDRREVWFTATDLSVRSPCPSAECPIGPVISVEMLAAFNALARGERTALAVGTWGPDSRVFSEGYARLRAAHPELASPGAAHAALLRLGTRLWGEGRRDCDVASGDEPTDVDPTAADLESIADGEFALAAAPRERQVRRGSQRATTTPGWSAERVQQALEWLAVRAAFERRRATWLTRLVDATVAWREPGTANTRWLIVEHGNIVERGWVAERMMAGLAFDSEAPPVPPGYRRPAAERRAACGVATFDRLRVLTTELKRLVGAGAPVAVRLTDGPPLAGERLAAALSWV